MASSVPVPEMCSIERLVKGVSEKKEREKPWHSEIVATVSTEPDKIWGNDREYEVKLQIGELKRKFHKNRHLRCKCLPSDVLESEVWQMLVDFPVSVIKMTIGHGAAGSASAYLEDPEMLEDWDREQDFMLRGNKIPVVPSPSEMLLCIGRIPLSYTPAMYDGLVKSFGEVNMSFLMISEKTGESKGYGFVEYQNKEVALNAKSKLSSLNVKDCGLWVEFVDPNLTTFESLHSKCLYVWNLPPNYCDMTDFRKKMSVVANPPYCQIALKNGRPLSWGLVEFNSAEDAEATFCKLNGAEFERHDNKDGSPRTYKMAYYIPGVRAIHLYLRLLDDEPSLKGKGTGLLPNPPPPIVYQTFENLRKQNPVFAQNVQKILISELFGSSEKSESMANNKSPEPFPCYPDTSMLTHDQRVIFEIVKGDVDNGTLTPQEASFILMRDVFGYLPNALRPMLVPQLSPTQGIPFATRYAPPPNFVHPSPMLPVHPWSMPPPASPAVTQPANGQSAMPRTQAVWPVSQTSNSAGTRASTPELLPKVAEESSILQSNHLLKNAQEPFFPLNAASSVVPGSSLNGLNFNNKPTPNLDGTLPYVNGVNSNYTKPIGFEIGARAESGGLINTPGSWAVPSKVRLTPSPQRLSKRKLSSGILPTPESSPKGNYIGQHSQGLGGHYSDSYFKRQRKNDDGASY